MARSAGLRAEGASWPHWNASALLATSTSWRRRRQLMQRAARRGVCAYERSARIADDAARRALQAPQVPADHGGECGGGWGCAGLGAVDDHDVDLGCECDAAADRAADRVRLSDCAGGVPVAG